MSVSRGLVLTALCGMSLGILFPASSSAQVYEAARRSLDLSPDPIARSPRLTGMGRLTLADDAHNRLNLWDFAANPTGVFDADSASTFALRPGTSASAARHTPAAGRERQYLGSRELKMGYEAWRRTEEGSTYGVIGEAASLRTHRPFSDDSEIRGTFSEPQLVAILNGKMPYIQSERTRYALTASYASENRVDEYRTRFSNAVGDYLGRSGDILPPPDFFTPVERRASTLGGGAGVSHVLAPWLTTALVLRGSSSRLEGENSSVIHFAGTGENRSTFGVQASAVGRGIPLLGWATPKLPLEWIYDIQAWTASSEDRWVFTLKAGINQDPFSGRGKLLDRDEDGLAQRLRLRWALGALVLGASYDGWRSKIKTTPPDADDFSSFNYFRNLAANRDDADSLALPDSVTFNRSEENRWSSAFGATWKLARGTLGAEYHIAEEKLEQTLAGAELVKQFDGHPVSVLIAKGFFEGPQRQVWDVRTGLEWMFTSTFFLGRVGYIYRSDDRDLLTQRNEFTSHSTTWGFGLVPKGSIWGLDVGYVVEWLSPDYHDPDDPRESRQQMAAQVHWTF